MTISFLFIFVMSLFFPQFQMPAYAVATPDLLAPADGATITATGSGANANPPVALPEFSWTAVSGTTQYRIQFSQQIGFSSFFEFTTPLTHFIPTDVGQFNDGLWYWRVKVDAPVPGNYQIPPRSFTKQWATLDNAPVLLSPAAGATLDFYDAPTFSWQPVIGAASYLFQVASDPGFNTIINNGGDYVIATTFQPANKYSNGIRYWRVIPIDARGHKGTSSQPRTVTIGYNQVPELQVPANNSYPTFTPTFSWKAVRGAQYYLLQYSTDPTFNANLTQIQTNNTTFTPTDPLPNDVDYYWRVRTYSGNSESAWSPSWKFTKQWYIRPMLLTPTNNFQHVRFPVFSWTPVPGASYYHIELAPTTDFVNLLISGDTSNPFYTPTQYQGNWNLVYWRVIPYDASGSRGKESDVWSYHSDPSQLTPDLIYPFYYYPPNSFPPPFNTVSMQPYADRTASWPIFVWNRITAPPPDGSTVPAAYRLQVSTSSLFSSIAWTVVTSNTYAAPTAANNFIPLAGIDYFWRVRGLNSSGVEIGNWSQVWTTRFNLNSSANQPSSPPPQLLRPLPGAEIVETTPLLEWIPVAGADSYEVQICDSASCSTKLNTTDYYASYPAYEMKTSLAQRSLGIIKYGTFYWRVQARSGGNPLGGWSETRRFQIASQSGRVLSRPLGSASNRLIIATDPDDTADNNYELTTLYAMQDSNFWYFGFNATVTGTNMSYGLYLDLDHKDNSGASSDPRAYTVSVIPAHLPEFAIYINQVAGTLSADHTEVYAWNGVSWNPPSYLSDIGGDLYYDPATGYTEIKVPNTSIGMRDDTGSYALSLFSVPPVSGQAVDSVPSDPNVPGSGPISRFASVTERMNTVLPPYTPDIDLTAYPFVFPFYWDYPTGSNGTAPWAGARLKVYRDPGFTTEVANFEVDSDTSYYGSTSFHASYDFIGDNTYYWRVQPNYLFGGNRVYGAWSQGGSFERTGFVPEDLKESVTFATPTFSWDMVEGATRYQLLIADNVGFASPTEINTTQNSFTPSYTLSPGTYWWKVRVLRWYGAYGEWSPANKFTLTLPVPTNLTPDDPDPSHAVHTTPTFCWQPLIVSSNGVPVLAAWRYYLQVSKGDPTFSSIYEQVYTEQSCWTSPNGYDDGTYYWRVAMLDGGNRQGDFSPVAVLTKQYPAAKPLSPVNGSMVGGTPTFSWTAADGVTPYVYGAAWYRIEISQFPTFSPLYEQIDTHNTRYIPWRIYDENKTYYWRVAIIDRDSKIGPFSNAMLILNTFPVHIYLPSVLRH